MDPVALSGLAVGTIGTAAAIVGAVAAVSAARSGKESPTKQDLARVEHNTAETARQVDAVRGQLADQKERDLVAAQAERLSISLVGQGPIGKPLQLHLTLKDPSVTMMRLDLTNEWNTLSGTADCERTGPLTFTATVDPAITQQWFDRGSKQILTGRTVRIRAFFRIDGPEGARTLPAFMTLGTLEGQGGSEEFEEFWTVKGGC